MTKKWLLLLVTYTLSLGAYALPLPANDVFQVDAKRIDPNTFVINWQVKPGYFLYRDRIKLTKETTNAFLLGTVRFPETSIKTTSQGQTFTVYRNQLTLPVSILGEQPGEGHIQLAFQGCADNGFCYPPETWRIKLRIDDGLALGEVLLEHALEPKPIQQVEKPATNSSFEAIFSNQHWPMILLSFFGFGFLLAFTPCVLPMVPVLSGIIVGYGNAISTRKAFLLSLSYVVSMSLTYAVIGAVVALAGSNLQIIMQSPWSISFFSLLFVLLAISMFGYYDLRLPVAWQAKLSTITRSRAGGDYLSAAVMGALSILILSPCITAPFVGALSYVAQSGNILLGSLALFALGMGMGMPLLLVGASAGKLLPKVGAWMETVKVFFGILLLGVAIYLVQRIVPASVSMVLWASLLIFTGIYSGALTQAQTKKEKVSQGIGIMSLLYGLLIIIGVSMGNTNPLQPLAGSNENSTSTPINYKDTVDTVAAVQQAVSDAKGKPLMLDFYADWCTSCKIMEDTLFKDPTVKEALQNFTVVKIDLSANNAQTKAILQHYNVIAPPTFIFLNAEGHEQTKLRLVGEVSAKEFLNAVNSIKTEFLKQ